MNYRYWDPELSTLVSALMPILHETQWWAHKDEIVWYVSLCQRKGFAKTPDEMRACAQRWMAGKRKVTSPGTSARKRREREIRQTLANTPPELMAVARAAVAVTDLTKLKTNPKTINALVGAVMKRYKADPGAIKALLESLIAAA